MKKKTIRKKYFDYVVENQRPPSSLKDFLKATGIVKETFTEKYDNLHAVESDIWKCALSDIFKSLKGSSEYSCYNCRERGLAFIYSWFECMDLNREFFKNCHLLKMKSTSWSEHLQKCKKQIYHFVKELLKNGHSCQEFKDRGIPEKYMGAFFWSLFCMNISSWKKCHSKKSKQKTNDWMDAMIEKSMLFFFDFMAPNLLDTFLDLLKHQRSRS